MALGEILAELGLQVILEFIFYGITYWLGFLLLKVFRWGNCGLRHSRPFRSVIAAR